MYTEIVDPAYIPLIHIRNDSNRTYTELISTQANSETIERPREAGCPETVAPVEYQNSLEMKTYANP